MINNIRDAYFYGVGNARSLEDGKEINMLDLKYNPGKSMLTKDSKGNWSGEWYEEIKAYILNGENICE